MCVSLKYLDMVFIFESGAAGTPLQAGEDTSILKIAGCLSGIVSHFFLFTVAPIKKRPVFRITSASMCYQHMRRGCRWFRSLKHLGISHCLICTPRCTIFMHMHAVMVGVNYNTNRKITESAGNQQFRSLSVIPLLGPWRLI